MKTENMLLLNKTRTVKIADLVVAGVEAPNPNDLTWGGGRGQSWLHGSGGIDFISVPFLLAYM